MPTNESDVAKEAPWRVVDQIGEDLYLMSRKIDDCVSFMPLYIHSFQLMTPRKLLEAQLFNQQYFCYSDIDNVPDRLRWCRHHKGLMQSEVAALLGISRNMYVNLETGTAQHIPIETAEKLSCIYERPATDFLDEFNQFLYDGQAQRIKAYRERLGMGKKPFARYTGIPLTNLREWESGRKVISHKCWERHFKGRA